MGYEKELRLIGNGTEIVGKAVRMAEMMNVKIVGIVENMSYLACPHCGEKIYPYGKSRVDAIAAEYSLPVLGRLPIDPALTAAIDAGEAENVGQYLADAMPAILGKDLH